MKRFLCLLLLFCSLSARAAEPPETVLPKNIFQNLREGKKQCIVVYGTSLTVGGAWAVALKEYFAKEFPGQTEFFNGGGSGQNSQWGVENLEKKVLVHRPDLVFIEFSYNDAHEKFKLTPEKAAQNLNDIVQALRRQNPRVDIVLQTMNLPWDAPTGNKAKTSRPQLEAFNDNYRRYARAHDLPLLDHYRNYLKLWQENPQQYQSWLPDGSHPTKEASLAVTWPAVRELLEKTRHTAGRIYLFLPNSSAGQAHWRISGQKSVLFPRMREPLSYRVHYKKHCYEHC